MKLRRSDWIAVIIALIFFQLMCLWCIDVSTSTMLMEQTHAAGGSINSHGQMTNGFFSQNPLMTYHIGLYILVITCFLSALISVHIIFQNDNMRSKKLQK